MKIAIDFDGTIVTHEFPRIGKPVPGAIEWLKKFQEAGAQLILWTMRDRDTLDAANLYLTKNGIFVNALNEGIGDRTWTHSPKAHAHIYIDDAAFGCPLTKEVGDSGTIIVGARPFVNWRIVGPEVMAMIDADKEEDHAHS